MATGRDDFLIAVRSAFLKKSNKQQFSLLVLILFSVVLIFLSNLNFVGIKYIKIGINEATYRLSAIISYPEKKINESFKKNRNIEEFEEILISKDRVIDMINKKIEDQIIASKDEESRMRNSKLYFNVLLRTKDIATSNYNIVEHYYNVVKKLKEVVI